MQQRVTGVASNGLNAATGLATSGIAKSALHSTRANFVGTKKLDEYFEAVMDKIRANPQALNRAVGPVIKNRVFEWDPEENPNQKKLKPWKGTHKEQFWALPYVGIQHSEHVKEE